MNPARWDRIATLLTEAGHTATVDRTAYYGGSGFSITLRGPGGTLIDVHDRWWRKNLDVWIGYEVTVEDAESIITRTFPLTKKRTEVLAAVLSAFQSVSA